MLLTLPALSGGAVASPEEVEDVKGRLALVNIDSLRLYENPEEHRVAEITQSLDQTKTLINPIVVDPVSQVLIDGHHRVRAFKWFGISRIPAFHVDYWSDAVRVKGWSRTTDAPPKVVEREFQNPPSRNGGPWEVEARDGDGQLLAKRGFDDPRASAQYVNHIACRLEVNSFKVELSTEQEALRMRKVHISTNPIITKSQVTETVKKGRVFPHEVNRHLIDRRPLELHVPLAAMTGETAFQDHVEATCERQPLAVPPGYRQGSRVYEERVIRFQRKDRP